MDEIFGAERFVAVISAVTNLKGRNDKQHIATAHEYLLFFAEDNFASYGFPLTTEQRAAFDQVDERGREFAWRDMRKRGGPDRKEDRPRMYFPIYWDERTGACSLTRQSDTDIEIFPNVAMVLMAAGVGESKRSRGTFRGLVASGPDELAG